LTIVDAVAVFAAVVDATGAAHAGGVVHRDITPSNIMLTSQRASADADGTVSGIRLLDFGLADVPGRTTRGADLLSGAASDAAGTGVVASVPMPRRNELSGAAVGGVERHLPDRCHALLRADGRPPFEGETAAVVRAHLSAPPPVPSARRRGIPPALDRLVTTAMLKRPQDRIPRMPPRCAALDAVIDVGRARRWPHRPRWRHVCIARGCPAAMSPLATVAALASTPGPRPHLSTRAGRGGRLSSPPDSSPP
jgi:serine/threonine-protein kinase